jgi:serine/threonine-protein kinase RsbW
MPGLQRLRPVGVNCVQAQPRRVAPESGPLADHAVPWFRAWWGEQVVKQAECRLAGEAAQVGAARQFVAELLGDGWPDADEAVLLISELASNAVLHSASGRPGGKFTVRAGVAPGDYLWVEVEDEGGPWTARTSNGEGGRGLEVVAAITDEWGRDGSPLTGWVVWARVDWPPHERRSMRHDGRPGLGPRMLGRGGPPVLPKDAAWRLVARQV